MIRPLLTFIGRQPEIGAAALVFLRPQRRKKKKSFYACFGHHVMGFDMAIPLL